MYHEWVDAAAADMALKPGRRVLDGASNSRSSGQDGDDDHDRERNPCTNRDFDTGHERLIKKNISWSFGQTGQTLGNTKSSSLACDRTDAVDTLYPTLSREAACSVGQDLGTGGVTTKYREKVAMPMEVADCDNRAGSIPPVVDTDAPHDSSNGDPRRGPCRNLDHDPDVDDEDKRGTSNSIMEKSDMDNGGSAIVLAQRTRQDFERLRVSTKRMDGTSQSRISDSSRMLGPGLDNRSGDHRWNAGLSTENAEPGYIVQAGLSQVKVSSRSDSKSAKETSISDLEIDNGDNGSNRYNPRLEMTMAMATSGPPEQTGRTQSRERSYRVPVRDTTVVPHSNMRKEDDSSSRDLGLRSNNRSNADNGSNPSCSLTKVVSGQSARSGQTQDSQRSSLAHVRHVAMAPRSAPTDKVGRVGSIPSFHSGRVTRSKASLAITKTVPDRPAQADLKMPSVVPSRNVIMSRSMFDKKNCCLSPQPDKSRGSGRDTRRKPMVKAPSSHCDQAERAQGFEKASLAPLEGGTTSCKDGNGDSNGATENNWSQRGPPTTRSLDANKLSPVPIKDIIPCSNARGVVCRMVMPSVVLWQEPGSRMSCTMLGKRKADLES